MPLYGVNHLAAHVAVDELQHGPLAEPSIALLVSGGHSSLLLVPDLSREVVPLGRTVDDAAGEAFDKVARVLGLPFPGGPPIDRAAREGDPAAIAFPRGLTGPRDAGLRLLLLRAEDRRRPLGRGPRSGRGSRCRWPTWPRRSRRRSPTCSPPRRCGPAASTASTTWCSAAGVAANSRLRALAEERCAAAGIVLRVPSPRLCTDNGAMVAALGSRLVAAGVAPSAPDLGRGQLAADRRRPPLSGVAGDGSVTGDSGRLAVADQRGRAPATRVTTTVACAAPGPRSRRASDSGLDRGAALLDRHPADARASAAAP